MTLREKDYFKKTKDSVYFGVGSYGNDPTRAGKNKLSSPKKFNLAPLFRVWDLYLLGDFSTLTCVCLYVRFFRK